MPGTHPWSHAAPFAIGLIAAWPSFARALEQAAGQEGAGEERAPYRAAAYDTLEDALRRREEGSHRVDVAARFAEFQRGMEADFGGGGDGDGGSETKRIEKKLEKKLEKVTARLEKRWADTAAFRLYRRLETVYERAEGFYERLEESTRWTGRGVEMDPDLEAVVDGKLGLHVSREIGDFELGLDVDDALEGRMGVRLGGRVGRYRLSFDASDVVADRRFSFQLRQIER